MLLVNGPLHFFPSWLIFQLTDQRSTQLHPLVGSCCARAVPFQDKGTKEVSCVELTWKPSRASLAVANHLDYFGIWFTLTPVTVDSVNTHVKYYLGIFKCLTTIASCHFLRGTRICIIPISFFPSFFFFPSILQRGMWVGEGLGGFFCHLSQHQGIPRQQVEFRRDSSKGESFSPSCFNPKIV